MTIRNLEKEEEFCQLKSAKLIAELCSAWSQISDEQFNRFAGWIITRLKKHASSGEDKLKSTSSQVVDVAIQCLLALLRLPRNRLLFFNLENGLDT